MAVKIFRDDNWDRRRHGVISGGDILGLDREKDRYLFDWLLLRLNGSKQKKIMERYHSSALPEEAVNIDDPDDEIFGFYSVLAEQVRRETDREALKTAAFRKERDSIGKFAFCRLTGFCWPPDACDAYSYRTYGCGLLADSDRQDIEAFCREMIEKSGAYQKEAAEWLSLLPDVSDETIASWKD